MNAIGYVRVSTDEQAASGLGLDSQTERIRAYCTLKELTLTRIVIDAAVSGGKPLASREGGQTLLTAIRRREADAVVMLKLDRMFRHAGDCLATVEVWERAGVALHVVDLGGNAIDTTSAAGRFMLVVLAGAAEMERNLTRERTRAALRVARARGVLLGSARIGWASQNGAARARGSKRGAENSVKVRQQAADVACADLHDTLRQLRSEGFGYRRLAAWLNSRGHRTTTGGMWGPATVRRVWLRLADSQSS